MLRLFVAIPVPAFVESTLMEIARQIPDTRSFLPHITIARRSLRKTKAHRIRTWLKKAPQHIAPIFEVDHFALYESRIGQEGAEYRIRKSFPLA